MDTTYTPEGHKAISKIVHPAPAHEPSEGIDAHIVADADDNDETSITQDAISGRAAAAYLLFAALLTLIGIIYGISYLLS